MPVKHIQLTSEDRNLNRNLYVKYGLVADPVMVISIYFFLSERYSFEAFVWRGFM